MVVKNRIKKIEWIWYKICNCDSPESKYIVHVTIQWPFYWNNHFKSCLKAFSYKYIPLNNFPILWHMSLLNYFYWMTIFGNCQATFCVLEDVRLVETIRKNVHFHLLEQIYMNNVAYMFCLSFWNPEFF